MKRMTSLKIAYFSLTITSLIFVFLGVAIDNFVGLAGIYYIKFIYEFILALLIMILIAIKAEQLKKALQEGK